MIQQREIVVQEGKFREGGSSRGYSGVTNKRILTQHVSHRANKPPFVQLTLLSETSSLQPNKKREVNKQQNPPQVRKNRSISSSAQQLSLF